MINYTLSKNEFNKKIRQHNADLQLSANPIMVYGNTDTTVVPERKLNPPTLRVSNVGPSSPPPSSSPSPPSPPSPSPRISNVKHVSHEPQVSQISPLTSVIDSSE